MSANRGYNVKLKLPTGVSPVVRFIAELGSLFFLRTVARAALIWTQRSRSNAPSIVMWFPVLSHKGHVVSYLRILYAEVK